MFFGPSLLLFILKRTTSYLSRYFYVNRKFHISFLFQVLPLENNMETPGDFGGISGVLNTGMTIVACLYTAVGFFGYLKYGEKVKVGSITLNLPADNRSVKTSFLYFERVRSFVIFIFTHVDGLKACVCLWPWPFFYLTDCSSTFL